MSNSQENSKTPQQNKVKKILGIVLNTLLWIFLVFAFIMVVFAFASTSNDYRVPIMGKKVFLSVQSPSMEPTIKKGDLIISSVLTTDEEKAELKVDDVITFYVDLDGDGIKELNTHRIIEVVGAGVFKTKGDNNQFADSYNVYSHDIIAVWHDGGKRIGGLGAFISFLQSRVGFLIFIVLPLIAFFAYEVIKLVLTILKLKNKDKKVITADDEEEIKRKAIEEFLRAQGATVTHEPAPESEPAPAPAQAEEKTETEEKTEEAEAEKEAEATEEAEAEEKKSSEE